MTGLPFMEHALAESQRKGPVAAMDDTVDLIQKVSVGLIPDKPAMRDALEAWGIPFKEGTHDIHKLIGSEATLGAELPEGWELKSYGGHNALLDDRGAERLRWHIHGWEPVSAWVCWRFSERLRDTGPSSGVWQVLDGNTVIHVVPINYPHPRTEKSGTGDDIRWFLDPDAREEGRANYDAKEDALKEARKWLDGHYAAWREKPIQAWLWERII